MAFQSFGAGVVQFYGEQITTNTTVSGITFPVGAEEVMVNCAAATRLQLAPRLILFCKTTDNEVTFTDYTKNVTDRVASTVATLSSLDTAANGDYFYVCAYHKFSGIIIDLVNANSSASVLSGYYWNSSTWADASITDTTANGGACLALDTATHDSITWTTPTAWAKRTISNVANVYAMRFQVSAALDSSTTIAEVTLVGDSTNGSTGAYLAASTDYVFSINQAINGGVNFIAGAGSTANLSWMKHTLKGSD